MSDDAKTKGIDRGGVRFLALRNIIGTMDNGRRLLCVSVFKVGRPKATRRRPRSTRGRVSPISLSKRKLMKMSSGRVAPAASVRSLNGLQLTRER